MTTKELIKETGWTVKEFAEYFEIPYRTVQNWKLGTMREPKYLVNLMEYKLRKEEII